MKAGEKRGEQEKRAEEKGDMKLEKKRKRLPDAPRI